MEVFVFRTVTKVMSNWGILCLTNL